MINACILWLTRKMHAFLHPLISSWGGGGWLEARRVWIKKKLTRVRDRAPSNFFWVGYLALLVTADCLLYAVDIVMVMTGSSRDDAGETLRCLLDEIFLSDKLSDWQISDHGGLLSIDCLSSLMSISPHVMSICTVAFMALVLWLSRPHARPSHPLPLQAFFLPSSILSYLSHSESNLL